MWNVAAAEIIAPSFMRPGDYANEYWASTGLCRTNDIILIECLKNGMKFASFTGGKDENALSNLRRGPVWPCQVQKTSEPVDTKLFSFVGVIERM